jgi:hypothetical protein
MTSVINSAASFKAGSPLKLAPQKMAMDFILVIS